MIAKIVKPNKMMSVKMMLLLTALMIGMETQILSILSSLLLILDNISQNVALEKLGSPDDVLQ
jgi:maltodextrin utilization protein YvdJ